MKLRMNLEKLLIGRIYKMREVKVGKIYRHFKGNTYKVIDIVYDSESNRDEEYKRVVIYEGLYGEHLRWARPYEMFNSYVDKDKYPDVKQKYRFEEVCNENI